MSSIINLNYMTRKYSDFLKDQEVKNSNRTKTTSFSDRIMERCVESRKVSETGKAGLVSTKDMTMEEYKQYIHDKISQIPMHPSRMQESISINISKAGFEAMKNDPEYEAWVLNDLRTGWAQPDRWAGVCGGAYSTIYYGATKEECHAEMWSAGYCNGNGKSLFDSKSNDSFWERRAEQKKFIEAQTQADIRESETKTEIVVKPDGSRVLVMTMNIGGMETNMSLEISKPTNVLNENSKQNTDNNILITENDAVSDEISVISNDD